MVWTSLGLVVAVFGGFFGFSLFKYIQLKDQPSSQGNIFQVWAHESTLFEQIVLQPRFPSS